VAPPVEQPSPDDRQDHERLAEAFRAAVDASDADRAEVFATLREESPHLSATLESLLRAAETSGSFLERQSGDAGALLEGIWEPPPPSAKPPTTPCRVGPFRVDRLIGRGAFADVFEAWSQEPPQRRVALKVLRAGLLDNERRWRLERECEALALVSHPNVAMLLDAGVADGRPWLAMEFVAGRTLMEWARTANPTPRQAAALLAEVCDGVHALHERGVIHRDLKPGNILVSEIDGKSRARVIDLGLARRVSADEAESCRTLTGAVVGTLPYIPPEALSGGGAAMDVRSDIYALGVVLHEVVAGCKPFESVALAPRDPPRLSSIVRGCPRELEAVVEQALAHDRQRRYGSAAAFAEDLRHVAAGRPVSARRSGVIRRAILAARRRPGGAATLLSSIGLLIALLLTLAWRGLEQSKQLAAKQAMLGELLEAAVKLGEMPGSDGPAANVAAVAERILADLSATSPEDPMLLRARARLLSRHAGVVAAQGRIEEAERLWTSAMAAVDAWLSKSPSTEALRTRSVLLVHLGECARDRGDLDGMLERYQQAAMIDEGLAREHPDDPGTVALLVYSYERLGNAARERGRVDDCQRWIEQQGHAIDRWSALEPEALGPLRARCQWHLQNAATARWIAEPAVERAQQALALERAREVIARSGATRSSVELLALATRGHAVCLAHAGELDAAAVQAREVMPALEELAGRDAERDFSLSLLASQWWTLGRILAEGGRDLEAEPALREALRLVRQAAAQAPGRAGHVMDAGHYSQFLSLVLARLGRDEEAVEMGRAAIVDFREATERWPAPEHFRILSHVLVNEALPSLRDPAGAVFASEAALQLDPMDWISWLKLATALEDLGHAEAAAQAAAKGRELVPNACSAQRSQFEAIIARTTGASKDAHPQPGVARQPDDGRD